MSGDSSEDTPREHIATDSERRRHFDSYPPGTLVVTESGPASPRSQFEIELQGRVKSLEDSRSFWKWACGLAVPTAIAAVLAIQVNSSNEIRASAERVGRTAEKIEALEKTIVNDKASMERILEILEQDIRELRKHAGLDVAPSVAIGAP